MNALLTLALIFAAFLIFLGVSSIRTVGGLSYAVIIGGALIAAFVIIFRLITFFKEKREDK